MTLERRIKDIMGSALGIDPNTIEMDDHVVDDLGADSMDIAELLFALEEEFDIDISDEDAQTITTLLAAVEYIEDYNG